MSSANIYALNSKSTTHLRSFQNGWGSAPVLWDYLGEKYLGWADGMPMFNKNEQQKLWDLARDPRMTAEEKICHMLTFDRAFVPIRHLEKVGDACYTVYADMPEKLKKGRVNHWYDIGSLFTQLAERKFHRMCRGICLAPTSVADYWSNADPQWVATAWPIFKESEPCHNTAS